MLRLLSSPPGENQWIIRINTRLPTGHSKKPTAKTATSFHPTAWPSRATTPSVALTG